MSLAAKSPEIFSAGMALGMLKAVERHDANDIAPTSPEAVFRYVNLLVEQKRVQDALPVVENASRLSPNDAQFRALLQQLQKMNGN